MSSNSAMAKIVGWIELDSTNGGNNSRRREAGLLKDGGIGSAQDFADARTDISPRRPNPTKKQGTALDIYLAST